MSRFLKYIEAALEPKPSHASTKATPLKPGTACSYAPTSELGFSKKAEGLAQWLSTPHDAYNMASLDFYGHLIDDSGNVIGFSSMIQQQFGLPLTGHLLKDLGSLPYLAEFSICDQKTNGVVVAPLMLEKDNVTFASKPYSETAALDLVLIKDNIKISLTSGEMGQKGACYKLKGQAIAFDLHKWEYEVDLIDTMGTIAVGYGPQSFLPQWLTTEQKNEIDTSFDGNVEAYLKAGIGDMLGAGSYYYSLPLLKVQQFSISHKGKPYAQGNKGYMWVDYVTQSFSEVSFPVLKGKAKWQFLAIQFPAEMNDNTFDAALMFSQVEMPIPGDTSKTSTLPMARLYENNGTRQPNSALNPVCEWNLNDIKFNPTQHWKDPKSGKSYATGFTLTLGSKGSDDSVQLTGAAVYNDQVAEPVNKYEGVFNIKGKISRGGSERTINGYAWAEIH